MPLVATALTTHSDLHAPATLLEILVTTTPLGMTALTTSLESTATTTPLGMAALTTSLEMSVLITPSEIIATATYSETSVNTLNSHQAILHLILNMNIINITTLGMDASVFYL